MRPNDLSLLIHLLGFSTGAFLYAMVGWMALRMRLPGRAASQTWGMQSAPRSDRIALATAALGMLWNVGALFVYGVRDLGIGSAGAAASAIPFAALGFLPAVVIHSAAQNLKRGRDVQSVVLLGYTVSGVSALMQMWAALTGNRVPNRDALLLLSAGYFVLTLALAFLTRKEAGWRRGVSAVALAAFAVMALHLSQHADGRDRWSVELLGHHASIALAFAILYQDYRFALADVFLKRVISALMLVAVAVGTYLTFAVPFIVPRIVRDPLDPQGVAMLITLWLIIAVTYPLLRDEASRFVDRIVLQRVNYDGLRSRITHAVSLLDDETHVLDTTCDVLRPALSAQTLTWTPEQTPVAIEGPMRVVSREGRQEASARVPTADTPCFVLTVSGLTAGRVLLSDDLRMLGDAANLAALRIDAVRLNAERIRTSLREREILQLATEAELRALRAQLNPHFLFNALQTIGYLMTAAPDRALRTLYRLTDLLRAVLRPSEGPFVPLAQEMEIVSAYLAIEGERFEERLVTFVDLPPDLGTALVPSLILQPIVENAVKHGVAPCVAGGTVSVSISRVTTSAHDDSLHIVVSDTGAGTSPSELESRRRLGIGLSSVEYRLERHFGKRARIMISSEKGKGTSVEITLPLMRSHSILQPAIQ